MTTLAFLIPIYPHSSMASESKKSHFGDHKDHVGMEN